MHRPAYSQALEPLVFIRDIYVTGKLCLGYSTACAFEDAGEVVRPGPPECD